MKDSGSFRTFATAYRLSLQAVKATEAAAERLELWIRSRLDSATRSIEDDENRWINPWTGFVLFYALLLTRSYHWIAHPQLFIEDGPEFYGNAFNLGSSTLFRSYMGYFHTAPRLIALFASEFHPKFGPLIMVISALAVQAGVASFLLSNRLNKNLGSKFVRGLIGLLIIGYPYSDELFGNVAHSQWYLAIAAVTMICATPGKTALSRASDYVFMLIASLTGPFSLCLTPITWWLGRGDRHRQNLALIMTVSAGITLFSILTHPRFSVHGRPRFSLFERMLSNQVVIGSTLGLVHLRQVPYEPFFDFNEFVYAMFAIGMIIYALRNGTLWMKVMALLGLFTFISCLYAGGNWIILGSAGVAERYFFVLGLVFVCACAMAGRLRLPLQTQRSSASPIPLILKSTVAQWGFRLILCCVFVGVVTNWVYEPPFSEYEYASQIQAYDSQTRGDVIHIMTPIDRKLSKHHWTVPLTHR